MKAELYWIDGVPPGRLAIMPRPRSNDWLRDELTSWHESGVRLLVSLLGDDEVKELELGDEAVLCQDVGLRFINFPIPDRGVPESKEAFLKLMAELSRELAGGTGVGIHCRAGLGRSALTAACLLVKAGQTPAAALAAISRARGLPVPDTEEQSEWIYSLASRLRASSEPMSKP
jgi:protein-tyrosine phosphatase